MKLKFISKTDVNDSNELAIYEKVEKSKLVLFILTDEYIQSGQFKIEYEIATKLDKDLILIFMHPLNSSLNLNEQCNSQQLNAIHIYQNEAICTEESFQRFKYLIISAFNLEDADETKGEKLRLIEGFDKRINLDKNKLDNGIVNLFDITENNHFLVISNGSCIHIFDRNKLNFIKTIKVARVEKYLNSLRDICYLKCLNKLCWMTSNNIYLLSLDYKKIEGCWEFAKTRLNYITYCDTNETIYIYCDYKNAYKTQTLEYTEDGHFEPRLDVTMTNITKLVKSMKAINDLIYYLTEDKIYVYNLDLNFSMKIGFSLLSNASWLLNNASSNYFYVVDDQNLKIFNANNFKYLGCVEFTIESKSNDKILLAGDNLILCGKRDIQFVKINFSKDSVKSIQKSFNEKFMCKMNSYSNHLLLDPYILPCGNIVCLKCIYENYNLYRNEFICGFEMCKENHCLTDNLKKSTIIKTNIAEISKNQIEYFEKRIFQISNSESIYTIRCF